MVKALIVGHLDIGESLLRTVKSISGSAEQIYSVSNQGLSTNEIVERINEICSGVNDHEFIIFVDVYGGSCWRAAMIAQIKNSHIITGLNLPMLLSFINKRDSYPFDELPSVIETDGKRGITLQ